MDNLREIARHLNNVQQYSRYLVASCPFHPDRSPSFFVYPDFFICRSCNAQGPTNRLLERIGAKGITRPKSSQNRTSSPFWALERHFSGSLGKALQYCHKSVDKALPYLYKRGVTDEIVDRLKPGYFEGWVIIPVRSIENGKIKGAIARAIDPDVRPRYYVPKGQDPNLLFSWNAERIKTMPEIYLTFGIFDALTLDLLGLAALSALSGTNLSPKSLDPFRRRIIVVPDEREERAGKKLVSKLGWRGKNLIVKFPRDTKDLNDIYNKFGLEKVQQLL